MDHDNIHGTGLVLDGVGMLFRGPSGSGKSLLALEFLRDAGRYPGGAYLVSDDRVELSVRGGELFMHAPATIRGLIELRGYGILERPSLDTAKLQLVFDFVSDLPRLTEESERSIEIAGVTLNYCQLPMRADTDVNHQRILVEEALANYARDAARIIRA